MASWHTPVALHVPVALRHSPGLATVQEAPVDLSWTSQLPSALHEANSHGPAVLEQALPTLLGLQMPVASQIPPPHSPLLRAQAAPGVGLPWQAPLAEQTPACVWHGGGLLREHAVPGGAGPSAQPAAALQVAILQGQTLLAHGLPKEASSQAPVAVQVPLPQTPGAATHLAAICIVGAQSPWAVQVPSGPRQASDQPALHAAPTSTTGSQVPVAEHTPTLGLVQAAVDLSGQAAPGAIARTHSPEPLHFPTLL